MSLFISRPSEINAINPNKVKRQPAHSFKAITAIGASRQATEFGGAADKIGALLKKAEGKFFIYKNLRTGEHSYALKPIKNKLMKLLDKTINEESAFARVQKLNKSMTKKAQEILNKLAKKDMPSFTEQDRDPKAKEVYRALKREHPEYSAGKKARIAENVANKV